MASWQRRSVCSRRCVWTVAAVVLAAPAALAGPVETAPARTIVDSGNIYNALWAAVIFLVLLLVLGRLAWKPVLQALAQRERHIADTLARAEARQAEGEELLARYRARVEAAEAEAAEMLQSARSDADDARREMLDGARRDAEDIAAHAAAEIETAKKAAMSDLSAFGADLATHAAERILRKEIDPKDHRRIIAESLEQIRRKGRWN